MNILFIVFDDIVMDIHYICYFCHYYYFRMRRRFNFLQPSRNS